MNTIAENVKIRERCFFLNLRTESSAQFCNLYELQYGTNLSIQHKSYLIMCKTRSCMGVDVPSNFVRGVHFINVHFCTFNPSR